MMRDASEGQSASELSMARGPWACEGSHFKLAASHSHGWGSLATLTSPKPVPQTLQFIFPWQFAPLPSQSCPVDQRQNLVTRPARRVPFTSTAYVVKVGTRSLPLPVLQWLLDDLLRVRPRHLFSLLRSLLGRLHQSKAVTGLTWVCAA